MRRREFLTTLAHAGAASVVLGAIPAWARGGPLLAVPSGLIERADWPEHWETSLSALGRAWITPNEQFFVRSHFPVPEVDAAAWRFEVTGLVRTPLSVSLDELRALPQADQVHTLECAGNGRGRYHLPSTSGTQWMHGAVGNARWGGVPLRALLERAGLAPEAKHVWLEAADHAPLPTVPAFLRSIPLEKAMLDTLLAHRMNGAALPSLHGAPLRAIVPGWYGMASTKWVTRVRVEAAPSDNHFMAKGYHYTYPGTDPAQAPPVEEMRIKSVITRPLAGAKLPPGPVRIRGFAWAGPSGVAGVEISSDFGASWRPATFTNERAGLAWRAWRAEVSVPRASNVTVMARAKDGVGDVQPDAARPNAAGYANNSIHRVTFHVGA